MKKHRIALTLLSCLGLFSLELIANGQPSVTTLAATGVTVTNATLHGTVNPNGASTTAYFQYGLTTNYGNIGTATVLPASNTTSNMPGFVVSLTRDAAGPGLASSAAGIRAWTCIASSADGLKLAAAATYGDTIYTSTNAGASWMTSSAPYANWQSIASSADGLRLAAGIDGGGIYTSTNSGLTWTPSGATNASWTSIASSFDGTRLAAAASGDGIYTSTNGGLTWALSTAPFANWDSIACSADGKRLAAVVYYGGIYISTNGGLTWTLSNDRITPWESIASSADGTRLVVGASSDLGVYLSTDSGASWTRSSGFIGYGSCHAIASSADGMRLAGVSRQGSVFTSTDGGVTWNVLHSPGRTLVTVAISADGTRLAVPYSPGLIYTSAGVASSLLPGTLYHYQLVGINVAGTTRGADLTFTTLSGAPTANTLAASGVTGTSAALNGRINTGGLITKGYFQYGLTTNYGSFSATNTLAATNTTLSVSNLIASLAPLTTYHFRLVGSNSAGTNVGADLIFTTGPLVPTVTTLAASSITASNGMLRGTVNPNSVAASAYFQYGLTTNYGSFSTTNSLAATNTVQSVSNLISSLTPGTTYHFRIVGINLGGTSLGADLPFTTSPLAPAVTTLAAPVQDVTQPGDTVIPTSGNSPAGQTSGYAIDNNSATKYLNFDKLNAGFTVTPSVGDTVLVGLRLTSAEDAPERDPTSFILSGSRDGGSFTEIARGSIPDFTARAFTVEVGFANAAAYLHYRLIFPTVRNAATANSMQIAEVQFPGRLTASASATLIGTSTNATLNGTVNPNGAVTTAYFQYGLTTNYGSFSATNTLAATNTTLSVSNLIGSLTPGTTYHFRLVAQNSAGTNAGVDLAFTTSPLAPTATTLAASSITATNARLNGSVNPNGAATTAYFQYGLTTNYGSFSATNTLAATNTTLSVSNLISGLTPGTTYHFRLVALNSAGTNAGVDLAFTTSPLAPTVTTLAASSVAATNASLNGSVNPGNGATTAYFQYGLTTGYGSFSATNTLTATNTTLSVSSLIGNLPAGTTYHFRLVALNSAGTSLGGDLIFTTLTPPAISSVTLSGTNLIFNVTNGAPGGGWTLLTTTNLAVPAIWSTNRSGTFDGLGSVTLTNGIIATEPHRFFIIRAP